METYQINIVLISETYFTNKSYFSMTKYRFYHIIYSAHGESAILIKNKIKHHEEKSYRCNEIQATNIIEDWKGLFTISSICSSSKHNIKKEDYVAFFKSLDHRF